MNKEFLKLQKIAGLITESEYKEKTDEVVGPWSTNRNSGDDIHNNNADEDYGRGDKRLDQEVYMDMLNTLFDALGNGANAYDDKTWTKDEKDLARNIASILFKAGVDIS